jgi:hypothetical protein
MEASTSELILLGMVALGIGGIGAIGGEIARYSRLHKANLRAVHGASFGQNRATASRAVKRPTLHPGRLADAMRMLRS